ncbi:hypothetical protein GH714_024991 [Hevea brasiliensis]|uniref:Serine-threonine/tyrosine-protein kinase catalytic domain-containing protein n=1 Tax=Hevea brasiliensis TaxID=3981 RepID=A0A6A6M083_HEVBR|nr:hypothetical protein GH714_024991 [Hevea brasiliensis]
MATGDGGQHDQASSHNTITRKLNRKGWFSEVYKGRLQNGKLVAIKRLTKGTADEKTTGFLSELGVMAHVDHPNTAKLLGCGIDGACSEVKLDWSKRYKIALGIAEGLLYFIGVVESESSIEISRFVILGGQVATQTLDSPQCIKFEGTFGYFAPEYFMHGIVDEKTDIYALVCCFWRQRIVLNNNSIKELVDPSLGDNYEPEEMERVCFDCLIVVILLKGDEYAKEYANEGTKKALQRTYSEELLDVQEYNSTKYLNDMKRHRELALEC